MKFGRPILSVCSIVAVIWLALRLPLNISFTQPQADSDSGIVVRDGDLHIGAVDATKQFKHSIMISNRGAHAATINSILPSCGCTQLAPTTFTLRPGESREVTVTINLFDLVRNSQEPHSVARVALQPTINGRFQSAKWVVDLLVRRPLILPQPIIDMGIVTPEDLNSHQCDIIVLATTTVTDVAISLDPKFPAEIVQHLSRYQSSTHHPRTEHTFRLRVRPSELSSSFRIPLPVQGNISGHPVETALVELIGTIDNGLRATVTDFIPTVVSIGDTIRWTILFADAKNGTGVPTVTCSQPTGFHSDVTDDAASSAVRVSCSYQPVAGGNLNLQVTLASSDGRRIDLPLRFYVTSAHETILLSEWARLEKTDPE